MTVLASRAGARVPDIVTVGQADNGDALIVVRADGKALLESGGSLTTSQAAALWADLGRLHKRRVTVRRIDPDRVVVRDDGTAGFGDLSSASVRSDETHKIADRVQLLALIALTADERVAIEGALAALGRDGVLRSCRTFRRLRCRHFCVQRSIGSTSSSTRCGPMSAHSSVPRSPTSRTYVG